ncbi:PAS domain-containing protein [Halosegnis marinus]|uniref:PAS domain-containing protein n=1 Tax=Halosegnis marinus TaxID=3034023 RepID=UPI00361A1D0F
MTDGSPDRLRDSTERDRGNRRGEPARIALAVTRDRNAELLSELLDDHDVVEAGTEVPPGTDVCVVDPKGFAEVREALSAWKRRERPAAAPVLLVAGATEDELWTRYAEAMGESLDAIQPVPAPRRAVRARVDGLLSVRHESLLAADRRARLELYERAMNGANVGISIADATAEDLPLVYVNDGFEEMTGYDRAEVLGRNCRFLQGEGTDPATVRRLREGIEAERPVAVEIRNYRKSGEPFWNRVEVVPVEGDDGETAHFIGFQRDVTERKDREELLAEYERVVRSVSDPILVLDADGTVRYVNEAAERAFGAGATGAAAAELFAPGRPRPSRRCSTPSGRRARS